MSVDENETCPNCGGSLRDVILKEKTRLRLEKIEAEEKSAEEAQRIKDEQDRDEVFDLIKTIAGSAAGGAIAGGLARAAGEFIKEDIKSAFRKK